MFEVPERPVCPHCGSHLLSMTMDDKGQFVTICTDCGKAA